MDEQNQSTINKNMQFRFLQYVSAEYEELTVSKNLYQRGLVKIPAQHFLVFYNGTESFGGRAELKLSDAFQIPEEVPELELRVQVLNINEGFNKKLKEACRTLKEYMLYVDKVRNYAKRMLIGEAVDKAVDKCIGQGVLEEFLLKNRAEVKRMSIFEYNEKAVRRGIRDEAYAEGETIGGARGIAKSILLILEKKGSVSEELRAEILEEKDIEILKVWLGIAAASNNVEEYVNAT